MREMERIEYWCNEGLYAEFVQQEMREMQRIEY